MKARSLNIAVALSIVFLVFVVVGAGFVWLTLTRVGRQVEEISFSDTTRIYPLLRSVEELRNKLNAFVADPSGPNRAALVYAGDVAYYQIVAFQRTEPVIGGPNNEVPAAAIGRLVSSLDTLLRTHSPSHHDLALLAFDAQEVVASLQATYSDMTYVAATLVALAAYARAREAGYDVVVGLRSDSSSRAKAVAAAPSPKHVASPVWQAGPAGRTSARTASA